MASIEEGLHQTPPREAHDLRADISHLLKNHCPCNKTSISKEEKQAIKELREDNTRVVLTACKGVAMVVMERWDYMDKALSLLSDTTTYITIPKDPTTRLRNSLINKLKDIKQQGGLNALPIKCYTLLDYLCGPPISMAFLKYIKQAPPKTHSVKQGVYHLWGGKGTSRYHLPPGRPVTPSP